MSYETAIVLQSQDNATVDSWSMLCQESVKSWAAAQGFGYRFEGDEFLERAPQDVRRRYAERPSTLADVARLVWARELLEDGAERVVWLDADTLVFDPERLVLPDTDHAFGREVWIEPEPDKPNRFRARRHVHNAVCLFAAGNPVLDFYLHAALTTLRHPAHQGPAQAVGPKLLTALHAFAQFPLIESVGALCPPVLRDLAALEGGGAGGPALDRFRDTSPPLAAANLCALPMREEPEVVERAIAVLLDTKGSVLRAGG